MPSTQLQRRQKRYFHLSSELAQLDNARLYSLIQDSETQSSFGKNHTLSIAGSKVFVKRVPVTDLEYDNMFSTRNMYDLPTYYNYGFNSAGLGVFRELAAHVKTTNWILDGSIVSFPLLYHYRIIPFIALYTDIPPERLANYVKYWGSNSNVGRYMQDRANAKHELVLFLEHFPHTVETWLLDNPGQLPLVLAGAQQAITFLRDHGILHMDSHFTNMLTDGKQVYLSDFGLALDKHFDLSPAEQHFYKQHIDYDYANLMVSILSPLVSHYRALPDTNKALISTKYGINPTARLDDLMPVLLNNIADLNTSGLLKIHINYVASLSKYRSVIIFMYDFYIAMRKNDAKDTPFEHAELCRLLKQSGFVPGPVSSR